MTLRTRTDLAFKIDSCWTNQIAFIVRLLHRRWCFIPHDWKCSSVQTYPWNNSLWLKTGQCYTARCGRRLVIKPPASCISHNHNTEWRCAGPLYLSVTWRLSFTSRQNSAVSYCNVFGVTGLNAIHLWDEHHTWLRAYWSSWLTAERFCKVWGRQTRRHRGNERVHARLRIQVRIQIEYSLPQNVVH